MFSGDILVTCWVGGFSPPEMGRQHVEVTSFNEATSKETVWLVRVVDECEDNKVLLEVLTWPPDTKYITTDVKTKYFSWPEHFTSFALVLSNHFLKINYYFFTYNFNLSFLNHLHCCLSILSSFIVKESRLSSNKVRDSVFVSCLSGSLVTG